MTLDFVNELISCVGIGLVCWLVDMGIEESREGRREVCFVKVCTDNMRPTMKKNSRRNPVFI
jgi:hypothetical protein